MPRCGNCDYSGYREDMWQCQECNDWVCIGYGGSDDINCFYHHSDEGQTCADCCHQKSCSMCDDPDDDEGFEWVD
jgi:hypothetical protein